MKVKEAKELERQILKSDRHYVIRKEIIRKYDLNTSLFLALLWEAEYKAEMDGTIQSGWFHLGTNEIKERIEMSYYTQMKCINNLQKAGILEWKNEGIPRKRYFRIDWDKFSEIIEEEVE